MADPTFCPVLSLQTDLLSSYDDDDENAFITKLKGPRVLVHCERSSLLQENIKNLNKLTAGLTLAIVFIYLI